MDHETAQDYIDGLVDFTKWNIVVDRLIGIFRDEGKFLELRKDEAFPDLLTTIFNLAIHNDPYDPCKEYAGALLLLRIYENSGADMLREWQGKEGVNFVSTLARLRQSRDARVKGMANNMSAAKPFPNCRRDSTCSRPEDRPRGTLDAHDCV